MTPTVLPFRRCSCKSTAQSFRNILFLRASAKSAHKLFQRKQYTSDHVVAKQQRSNDVCPSTSFPSHKPPPPSRWTTSSIMSRHEEPNHDGQPLHRYFQQRKDEHEKEGNIVQQLRQFAVEVEVEAVFDKVELHVVRVEQFVDVFVASEAKPTNRYLCVIWFICVEHVCCEYAKVRRGQSRAGQGVGLVPGGRASCTPYKMEKAARSTAAKSWRAEQTQCIEYPN